MRVEEICPHVHNSIEEFPLVVLSMSLFRDCDIYSWKIFLISKSRNWNHWSSGWNGMGHKLISKCSESWVGCESVERVGAHVSGRCWGSSSSPSLSLSPENLESYSLSAALDDSL